ncbi:hypothetical protein SEPL_324 [Salmonella phage SE_PL]|nr:hypothetical protein CPT_Munch_099 [Salmonella phage Munch]ECC6867698.1 hypothetical protein [Salmonella enterica]ECV9084028.1 hypothetical protein [Salmonella enterica subsp. enterica serovar Infantis]MCP0435870.1 hypothetical protein [Salmonella enterica subsp. enterica serovar Mbandaka]QCW18778.1 hypothetical protein 7t3_0257 [Salmonella phage 7t3]QIG62937.1 hypothetical protein SEPL_324 [Salmonella phage SE_PL]WNV47206.1 hypothetical protein [Klebsiella phage fENko-Kae01]
MSYNIRMVPNEVWFQIQAKYVEHNTTVYKKPDGKQYTLLDHVTVGESTIQCTQETKFLYSGMHKYESISGDTVFWIKATLDDIHDIVEEIDSMGSDWNK